MPRRTPLVPMPVTAIGTWDNVRTIHAILDEAESGTFVNAARLVDQVLRDDRIFSTIMTRVLSLLGKPQEFEPPKDTAQGRKHAEELKAMWPEMAEHSALVELLIWGITLGVGVAQVTQTSDPWKLEVWHPWALTWDPYEGCYLIQGRDSEQIRILPDGKGGFLDEEGRRWVLFTPYGFANAGRRGLLRALADLYLERRWAHRDRARYSEVHGQPMRIGIAPIKGVETDQIAEFRRKLAPAGSESVVILRQGEEGNRWDVKLVEAMGKSNELFEQEIAQLDRAIATLVLGQSQSTDGQAGLGSNDQAGEPVRLDIMRGDAESLTPTIRKQFLMPYYRFAYGNADMAPWWCIKVDPPEDRAKKATELKTLVEALAAAKAAALPLDQRAILEAFGQPMISEEEQAKLEAQKREEAAAQNQPPQGDSEKQSAVGDQAA